MRTVWMIPGLLALVATACSSGADEQALPPLAVDGVPDEVRVATAGGEPRTPGGWARRSTCAPGAGISGSDGGDLLDDLIAPPGIPVAGVPIADCPAAVTVLEAEGRRDFDGLAAHVLAAELSRTAAAETCEVADQARRAGHIVLEQQGYTGPGSVTAPFDVDAGTVLDLLQAYAAGDLCG